MSNQIIRNNISTYDLKNFQSNEYTITGDLTLVADTPSVIDWDSISAENNIYGLTYDLAGTFDITEKMVISITGTVVFSASDTGHRLMYYELSNNSILRGAQSVSAANFASIGSDNTLKITSTMIMYLEPLQSFQVLVESTDPIDILGATTSPENKCFLEIVRLM